MTVDFAHPVRPTPRTVSADGARVAVVITTYNHAHFLDDAINSVLAQTRLPDEIIVVDDGSEDHPEAVLAAYPAARLIRQPNRGLAAARNAGLAATSAEAVIFLDADDRLLPNAVAAGLRALGSAPECGFAYGGHRRIAADGTPLGGDRYDAIGRNAYATLLHGNVVGMHATVMYAREKLIATGGFDASLPRCEDYDVYLKLARTHSVLSHPEIVAEYRWHDHNISRRHREMLGWVLRVHERQKKPAQQMDVEAARAWRKGRAIWRDYYWEEMLSAAKDEWRRRRKPGRALTNAALAFPWRTTLEVLRVSRRRVRSTFTSNTTPEPGRVRLGDLDRLKPISPDFGYDRGTPVDRYYIEGFLARHAADVRGRVLEIGDDSYTRRFGGDRVQVADILHVNAGSDGATIIGDLASPGILPAGAFDCVVITQTLHLIYDMRIAVQELFRGLRPGGIALVTVPGISPIDRGEWKESWHWSLTETSARRLFAGVFGDAAVSVESHGNVFAATAFLHGLALEEIERNKLDFHDEAYPVVIAIRAQKAVEERR
jgi:glycosyltransferase involved in cell wall biosynthesis